MTAARVAVDAGDLGPLAIICGGGVFPRAVADAAIKAGREVVLYPISGFADPWVETYRHEWIHLGGFGQLRASLRRHRCRQVVIVGTVMRPRLRYLRFDLATLFILPRAVRFLRGGDNHLLTGLARIFEDEGFELIGAHEVAPEILLPAGTIGSIVPTAEELDDVALALDVVHNIGRFDIGQAVVVARRHVIAVEASEGTDLMLARCKEMRDIGRIKLPPRCGVLVKAPKPEQDRRLDMPSMGARTVQNAAAAGLAGIAVEAGGVIATDMDAMIEEADRLGLFLIGLAG